MDDVWEKMKTEYISGTISYRELAEKYGVSQSSLMKRGANEKWGVLRKKRIKKQEEKMIEKLASSAADRAVQISDVANNLLRMIAMQVEAGAYADSQSIRQITGALRDLRDLGSDESEREIKIVWSQDTEDYGI